MTPVATAVTDHVHLVQGYAANWLIITGGDGVTLIDAGLPGDRDDVLASLSDLGFGVDDVRGIVLTHAHVDHLGSAIWFAKTQGTPVYCHRDEVGHAKREYLQQASPLDIAANLWRPSWVTWTAHLVRNGGLSREGIPTAQALTADVAAMLPGQPKPIPTPGHTSGHCSYIVDGVLASGDALITGFPTCRRKGRSFCRRCSATTRPAVNAAWQCWRHWRRRSSHPATGRCGVARSATRWQKHCDRPAPRGPIPNASERTLIRPDPATPNRRCPSPYSRSVVRVRSSARRPVRQRHPTRIRPSTTGAARGVGTHRHFTNNQPPQRLSVNDPGSFGLHR